MPSESSERKQRRSSDFPENPPPTSENVACPRCESINTKFCYYNNYNMSQPRYFCKGCRRYWTQGGTLRNIPFGGSNRKNSKRIRTSSSSAASSSSCSSVTYEHDQSLPGTMMKNSVNLNDDLTGSFSDLLNSRGNDVLALGGYGIGVRPMFEEMSYGLTKGIELWPYSDVGGGYGSNGGGGDASVAAYGHNFFPTSANVDGVWPDVDCYGWPDLAISMPGNGLK